MELTKAIEIFKLLSFPILCDNKITEFENSNNIRKDYVGNRLRAYLNWVEEDINFSDIPEDAETVTYTDSEPYKAKTNIFYDKGIPCNEDIFETIDILESVLFAIKNKSFRMIEAGAGYGFWTAIAHRLCVSHEIKDFYALGVEPEPTRIAMYHRHMLDNNIQDTDIFLGIISNSPCFFDFNIGNSYTAYGDSVQHSTGSHKIKVRGFSLQELLRKRDFWDILDFDCQGAEENCFDNCKDELNKKVRKISVATHSELADKKIPKIFSDWIEVWNFDSKATSQTIFGTKDFVDGRKTYVNPEHEN